MHAVEPESWPATITDPDARVTMPVCRIVRRSGNQGPGSIREETTHHIACVIRGDLQAWYDSRWRRLPAGTVLWTPPDRPRGFRSCGVATAQINLQFRCRHHGHDLTCHALTGIHRDRGDLRLIMRLLLEACARPESPHGERHRRALLAALGTAILDAPPPGDRRHCTFDHDRRLLIADLSQTAVENGWSSRDLARHLNLGHDWFTRVFRATYGCSPRVWLKRERIQLAALRLRESPASVMTVAASVGAASESLFYRQFREIMGCAPEQWRAAPEHASGRRGTDTLLLDSASVEPA